MHPPTSVAAKPTVKGSMLPDEPPRRQPFVPRLRRRHPGGFAILRGRTRPDTWPDPGEPGLATTRTESDSMGAMEVPADAYYGAQTRRAELNFQISPLRFPRRVHPRHGAHQEVGRAGQHGPRICWTPPTASPIVHAAQAVADGRHDDQFVVDVFQTGSGTSTNMNTNEVIAGPRQRDADPHPRREVAHPPQRRRQHGSVVQRRHPDGHPRRRPGGAPASA